jgi:hypothetical protein
MIEKITGFKVGEQFFPTIEDAQKAELVELLSETAFNAEDTKLIAAVIVEDSEKIIDILTMKPSSRPKARKINGGRKKRTKTEPEPELPMPPEAA